MSDRLTLANAIEDAGIQRAKAERVASVIIDVIDDNVRPRLIWVRSRPDCVAKFSKSRPRCVAISPAYAATWH
jgi:hypothetical protein